MSLFDQTPEETAQQAYQAIKKPNALRNALMIAGGLVVAVTVVSNSMYTITTGTVGVMSTFNKYNHQEIMPGLSFKIPYMQNVMVMDVKMQTANYNGLRDDDGGDDGIYNVPQIQVLDEKNLTIGLDVSVQFNVNPNSASELLEKYGQNYFAKALNPVIRDVVRDVAGKYQAETIANNRNEINASLEVKLQEALARMPEFTLQGVSLRDIILPTIVTQKINQVQEAKQEEQRLKMIELQAQQDQKIKETQANTALIQVTTAARAEAEKLRIEAEGRALAISVEAKAQAEANTLIAKSLSPELVKLNEVQRWNGQMPQTLIKDGVSTGFLLNSK